MSRQALPNGDQRPISNHPISNLPSGSSRRSESSVTASYPLTPASSGSKFPEPEPEPAVSQPRDSATKKEPNRGRQTAPARLDARGELIRFFVNLAHALSLPRSIGELYGTLFCAPVSLSFDQVVEQSGVSKGSASHGLRFLTSIGALHMVHLPGDRRTYYKAETAMRRLVDGFLRQTVEPHLRRGAEHLDRISRLLEQEPADSALLPLEERISHLMRWNRKAAELLPWLIQLTSTPDDGEPEH